MVPALELKYVHSLMMRSFALVNTSRSEGMAGAILEVTLPEDTQPELNLHKTEVYSEPYQACKLVLFAKIVNVWKPLTISVKSSILDFWQVLNTLLDDVHMRYRAFHEGLPFGQYSLYVHWV